MWWAMQFSSKDPAQGYSEPWLSSSKKPLTLAGLLKRGDRRTRAELSDLCGVLPLAEQEEAALFKDFKAGQTSLH